MSSWQQALAHVVRRRWREASAVAAWSERSQWQEALLVWDGLGAAPASASVNNAAVSALVRGVEWEAAMKFLQKEVTFGIEGYSCGLFAACEVAAWRHCLALLAGMQERRIQRTTQARSAAMAACGKRFRWEIALELFENDPDCRMAALRALQVAYQWEEAVILASPDLGYMAAEACKRGHAWQAALNYGPSLPAMKACAAASQWQRCLLLLRRLQSQEAKYTAQSAMVKASQWQRCLSLGAGASSRPVVRALAAARRWAAALQLVQDAWATGAVVGACQAAGEEQMARQLLSQCLEKEEAVRPKRKELRLLRYLESLSLSSSSEIVGAIEDFAAENWLKVAAGEKAKVLQRTVRTGTDVLEVGTYVGLTALRLAAQGCRVTTLEADPVNAAVAQKIFDMAEVKPKLLVGSARERLSDLEPVDVLLLDHRGTVYHEDLLLAPLKPGALVLADNVLHPGAPLFLQKARNIKRRVSCGAGEAELRPGGPPGA